VTETAQTTSHWKTLAQALHELPDRPSGWQRRDAELFMEVEALLYLYVSLTPDAQARSAGDAWALVSGYCITGLNDQDEPRRRCLRLRAQLRYMRTISAWKSWLRWYQDQPETLRLFSLDELPNGDLHCALKLHSALLYDQRIAAYEERCTQIEPTTPRQPQPFASAGEYRIFVDNVPQAVKITEAMAAFAAQTPPVTPLLRRSQREPLVIHFNELQYAAIELDQKEHALGYQWRGNWHSRLNKLKLELFDDQGILTEAEAFTIDGVFHLVGKLGVGKSTLMWLITYWLVTKRGMHITLVLNTVAETIRMAEWLVRIGIRAVPALGRDRQAHGEKYAAVTDETLHAEIVFDPSTQPAPVFDWLPKVCALSGAVADGIPMGQEPCDGLRDIKGDRCRCPLFNVCPVHQARRSMVDAQVWLVNPYSFLHSAAPETLDTTPLRLLEAIYHRSDLVIVDEADRVQVQWDTAFAPLFPVAGGDDSLLDTLHPVLGAASVGRKGRRKSANAAFNQLINIDGQAHTLANHLFRLIEKNSKLAKWIERSQLTNRSLFQRLIKDLLPTVSKRKEKEVFKDKLTQIFTSYWRKGKIRVAEAQQLTEWIDLLMTTTEAERRMQQRLTRWLTRQMGWSTPLDEQQRLLVVKLDFCLTMTALLKRVSDILYLYPAADIEELDSLHFSLLREELVSLVPDPPIGAALGIRHLRYEAGQSAGIFAALDYRGLGRWLLTNFPTIYYDLNGSVGPHLLLTSATSWFPGAASFNLTPRPHALLLPKAPSTNRIHVEFKPVAPNGNPLFVSGAVDLREANLRQITRELAQSVNGNPSDLQRELDRWETRRVLLVVNSYEQVDLVFDELQNFPEWRNRVMKLLPDHRGDDLEGILRAGQAEAFRDHDADVLIAPLLAIQRGFNILDDADNALLGSVFFLVRPYPPPEDVTPQLLGLNQWTTQQLEPGTRTLNKRFSEHGIKGLSIMRREAYFLWNRRIKSGNWGLKSLSPEAYDELLRDQFVLIWQTIGRLLRGDKDARVYFVDAAYATKEGRHTLYDWYQLLQGLIQSDQQDWRALATALYQLAYDGFERAHERGDLGE
jgi:hypothetical protein